MRRQRGTGSVKWRTDRGRWAASVTLLDGTRRSRLFDDPAEAEAVLDDLRTRYRDDLGYHYRMPRPYFYGSGPKRPRAGVTASVRWRVMERDGHRCVYCGADPTDGRLVIDHRIPIAKGGTDDEDNLVTACETCNLGKADR